MNVPFVTVPFRYDDGGRARAGYAGPAEDCVVRAIAIAACLPYRHVYDELHKRSKEYLSQFYIDAPKTLSHQASPRNSVSTDVSRPYLRELGWVWTPTMKIGSGCKVHLRADELPAGRLIVDVSRHVVAVINGVIHDTYDCSRNGTRCVYGYWQEAVRAEP